MHDSHHTSTCIRASLLTLLCLKVVAQPGNGIRLGQQTLLVPSVSVYYIYDDNVILRERALTDSMEDLDKKQSDSYLSVRPTLDMTHWNATTRYASSVWFQTQRYQEHTELDDDTYGVEGSMFWIRPNGNTTVKVMGSFQRAIERSERSDDFTADLEQSREIEDIATFPAIPIPRTKFVLGPPPDINPESGTLHEPQTYPPRTYNSTRCVAPTAACAISDALRRADGAIDGQPQFGGGHAERC